MSKKDGMTKEIIKDIDGNSYRVVKIGTQYWLADNFRSTRFTDGNIISDAIPYRNNPIYFNAFGLQYNWEDFNNPKLAPEGWRVPSIDDFRKLMNAVGYRDSIYNDKLTYQFTPTDSAHVLWSKITDNNFFNITKFDYYPSYFCTGNGVSYLNFSQGYIYFSVNQTGTRLERSFIRLIKK